MGQVGQLDEKTEIENFVALALEVQRSFYILKNRIHYLERYMTQECSYSFPYIFNHF